MNTRQIHIWISSALLAALTYIGTIVVQIPSPMNGFVNLGDIVVLLCAYLLGPWHGAVAGGVGSLLADALTGYLLYAPGTLIIKSLMVILSGLLYRAMGKRPMGMVLSAIAAEIWMVLGYFLYAAILLGNGLAAASSIPGNLMQAAFAVVGGPALALALRAQTRIRARFPAL